MKAIETIDHFRIGGSRCRIGQVITAVGMTLAMGETLHAQTVTTIINESPYVVRMELKWASSQYSSGIMALQPGGETRPRSMIPGDELFIRFNASVYPGQVNLRQYRLHTASNVPDFAPGIVNSFRMESEGVVDIRPLPNQITQGPPIQSPRPAPPQVRVNPGAVLDRAAQVESDFRKAANSRWRDAEKGYEKVMKGRWPF